MKEKLRRMFIVFGARFIISMKIYFRYPVNFIMTLIEPIMWLTPYYFLGKSFSAGGKLSGFEKYTGNSDYIGFIVIGYMISSYVNTVFWTMGFSLKEEMRQGVLESNWSAPVNRVLLMVSKSTFQFTAATFEIILTGIICHFIFGFSINSGLIKVIAYLIPGIIGMMGLGLMIGALVLMAKEANAVIDISSSVISALAGGFFPIKVLPKGVFFISMTLPLTYVYDSSRAILINQIPLMSLRQEIIIIFFTMFIFCILGSFVFNMVERKCRMTGNLGTH